MNALTKRVLSAAAAIIIIFVTHYFLKTQGLIVLSGLIALLGVFEYTKMTFTRFNLNWAQKFWFLTNTIGFMIIAFTSENISATGLCVLWTLSLTGTLWLHHGRNNNQLLEILLLSALGHIYCGLLPLFAIKTLTLNQGVLWFLYLCVAVFSGDIFAYFGGRAWGQRKLAESLSPNKTIAGAIAGVLGSILAAVLSHFIYLNFVPLPLLIFVTLLLAVLAQSGDLFESLLKRVSAVKDSGGLMPGHGGILDRLDGLYFAAPLVYFVALNY